MLIEVDPIAREIVLDWENGLPPISLPLGCLLLKYPSAGPLACHMDDSEVEVSYQPLPDESSHIRLEPLAMHRWRVAFTQGLDD